MRRSLDVLTQIQLPRISGTAHDRLLNDFIDSVNAERNAEQPKLAAHAAAAIGKFLMVNHETSAGPAWLAKAMAIVGEAKVHDKMVDKLYDALVERSTRTRVSRTILMGILALVLLTSIVLILLRMR
jgi:hypothetical protein